MKKSDVDAPRPEHSPIADPREPTSEVSQENSALRARLATAENKADNALTVLRILTDALQERYREKRGDLREWAYKVLDQPDNRITPEVRLLAHALTEAYRVLDWS